MSVVIIGSLLIGINVTLWVVAFVVFKNRFSSKVILMDIEREVNNLITDLNRQADQNVTLIDGQRKGLLKLLEEAKKYTELANSSLEKKSQSENIMKALNGEDPAEYHPSYPHYGNPYGAFSRKPVESVEKEPVKIDIVEEAQDKEIVFSKDFHSITHDVTEDVNLNNSLKSLSVKLPRISVAEKPIKAEKNLRTKVLELHAEGFDLDVIAKKLEVSITEVQLIINMYGV